MFHSLSKYLKKHFVIFASFYWKWRTFQTKERKFSLIITKTILQETGFPRLKFFTAYNGQVFFRIFTFHIRFDDLFLYACINTRKSRASMWEKLHNCQRTKTRWTWHVISIIAENEPQAYHKTQFAYSESWPHPTS